MIRVLVPSRNRPQSVRPFVDALLDTGRSEELSVHFIVNDDDPTLPDYQAACEDFPRTAVVDVVKASTMVQALNAGAARYLDGDGEYALYYFAGDDHRFVTNEWMAMCRDATEDGSHIIYGDDLVHGEALPTACALTVCAIRALGWMAPPCLNHMYVDNFWLNIGRETGLIQHVPSMIVRHDHPIVERAAWDEDYERVNAFMKPDANAYVIYRNSIDYRVAVRELVSACS